MPWSSNATFLVNVALAATTTRQAIYKPVRGRAAAVGLPEPGLHRREVAAYRSREALGSDLVPPTVLRDGPARRGLAAAVRRRRLRAALLHALRGSGPTCTTSCGRSACSTCSPTTPTARAATACSARRPHLGHRPRAVLRRRLQAAHGDLGVRRRADRRRRSLDARRAAGRRRAAATSPRCSTTTRSRRCSERAAAGSPPTRCSRSTAPAAATPGRSCERRPVEGRRRARRRSIHRADLDGLVRLVDALTAIARLGRAAARCATAARPRSRPAASCGRRRRWPSTAWRWGAGRVGGRVLDEDAGRFTIGPLTEVVAAAPHVRRAGRTSRRWAAARLRRPRARAPRRTGRGRLSGGSRARHPAAAPAVGAGLPRWPTYTRRRRDGTGASAPVPTTPGRRPSARPPVADDPEVAARRASAARAVDRVVQRPCRVAAVEGDADAAVAALGVRRRTAARSTPTEALAWLAWAGASGGAHGRAAARRSAGSAHGGPSPRWRSSRRLAAAARRAR